MPQTFDYMGARRAGYSVKEIQQATKDIDIQNALEQWGEKFFQKQAKQREAVNSMVRASRNRASAGLTPAQTLYPAGVTRDPIGQDMQNMATAPRVPRPTGIVRAENVAPDLVSAFEHAPESSLGDATSGYLSEAPNVKLRGARGIVQGIKDAPKAGWLGLNQAASAGMQAIGDVVQEDIGILTKAAKATSDLLTLNMSPTEIPADTGSNVIQRVGRDAYAAHTQGMQELADKYAPDSWGGAVMNAGAQTGQQLGILATAAAIGSRSPAAMTNFSLGALGAQSGLTEYGDARAKGFDVPRSMLKAGVGGGMEVLTEVAPMGKLVNFMSAPAKKGVVAFLKDAAEYGLQDIGGELLNTMITDVVNNKMQARPNMTPQEQADEVSRYFTSGEWKQAAADTFKQALLQSGMMMGAAKGVQHLDAKIRGEQSPLTDGVTFQPQNLPPVNPERQGRVDKLAGIMANESERTAQMRLNIANQRRDQQPVTAPPAQQVEQVAPEVAQPVAPPIESAQQQEIPAQIAPAAEAPETPVATPAPAAASAQAQDAEAVAPELADLLRRKTNLEKAIFAADGTEKKTATKRMKDNYAALTATITALQQQNPEQEVVSNGQQAEPETATAEPGAVAADGAGGAGGAAPADETGMGSAEAVPGGAVSGVDEQSGDGMPVLRSQPDVAEAPQKESPYMEKGDEKYLLTNDNAKEDGYGVGTEYETKEPNGDTVTVYRAVPNNVNDIQYGDYVTTSRKYAEDHLEMHTSNKLIENPLLVNGGKIVSKEVPKSELVVAGANELFWKKNRGEGGADTVGITQYTSPDIMALVDGKTDDQVQKTIDMVRGLNPERAGQIEAYWKSKATPVAEPQAEQDATPAAQDGQESVPPAGEATQKGEAVDSQQRETAEVTPIPAGRKERIEKMIERHGGVDKIPPAWREQWDSINEQEAEQQGDTAQEQPWDAAAFMAEMEKEQARSDAAHERAYQLETPEVKDAQAKYENGTIDIDEFEKQLDQAQAGSAKEQATFQDMVREAARWKGAALNAEAALGDDKKARLAHSRMTTKADLDAYLMRKFGVDDVTARSVSNDLTAKNVPADKSAQPAEFAGEAWAVPNIQPVTAEKKVAQETAPDDLKGFNYKPGDGDDFSITKGNLTVKATSQSNGKYQASWGSATSSPHLDKQTVVDWAENIIKESQRAEKGKGQSKSAAQPPPLSPVAAHDDFIKRLDEGSATPDELKTTGANARVVEMVKAGEAKEGYRPTVSRLTPAGKRGSAQAYTVHLSPSQAMSLKEIRQEVSDGEAGGRVGIYNDSAPGTTQVSWGSSFPGYFQNRGLTKKQVLPILDRIIRGESVTEAQWLIAEDMLKAKRYGTLNRILNERQERRIESLSELTDDQIAEANDFADEFFSQFDGTADDTATSTGGLREDDSAGSGRDGETSGSEEGVSAPATVAIDESGWGQQVAAELQGDKKQVRFGDKKQTGRNVGLSEFMDEFTPDPQGGLFGESTTLDFTGLQQIYERLANTKLVKDAMADLKRLGMHVYAQGRTAWKPWFQGMKDSLGKLFRRFRPTMEKLWQTVNNERGSLTLRTDRTGDPRVDAVLDKIGSPDKTLADRIKDSLGNLAHKETRMREIEQGFFDRYASLRYLDKMAGITGPDDSAYISARMSTSFSDVMYAMVHHGHPIWKDGGSAVSGKGLMEIFKPVADELDVFMGWMVGERAQKLMNEGRERYFDQDEINILKGLKTPENSARWEKVRREYMQYKKQVLDFAEQAGVINPEARKIWDHEEYVPFYRVVEDKPKGPFKVKGLASQNSGIRTLKGADERLGDIFENIIRNFSHLTDAAIKNRATELAVQKAEQIGAATPAPLEWKAVKIGNQQVVDAVHEFFGETQDDIDAFVNPEEMEAFTTFFHPAKPMGKDVIHVLRDGKPQYYQVHDDLLLRSMTSINEQIWGGPAMTFMRFVKRLLTIGVTSDPTFMLRNFIRDTLHTWTISRGDFTPVISSLTGAVKAFREDDDMVQLMAAGGAFHGGFAYGNDPAAVKLMVRKLITKKGIDRNTILDTVKKVWGAYQEIGSAMENAARVQTYANAKAKTGSHLQAAFEAKDIMDFSMRGDWAAINFLVQTVPFLGARIQGLQRLGKGAMENPVAFTLKGTAIALASTLLWLHNSMRPEYQELEEWDKDTYFHFFVGKKHFRLPKPFEVGAIFGTMPERLMELTLEKQHDGGLFFERMMAILTQTFAVGLPQILNEPMQQWANKDFFTGREIVGRDLQRLLPGEQSTPYTSVTAKGLGRAINFSPKRIEHAVKGYFGTLGMYCLGASDILVRKLWDYPSEPATKPEDWPVLSAFYRGEGPARNTKYTTEFYELLREADQLTDTVQRLRETGEVPRAEKLIEKNLPKLAAGGILGQAQSELSRINKQMKVVHLNRSMSPDEKRAQLVELQRIKNEITRGVVGQAKDERNQ